MSKTANKIIDVATLLVGGGFVALAIMTTVEVLLRKLFNLSLRGVDEIGGYVYAIGSAVGFSAAFVGNSHVRVDLILSRLGPILRLPLHLLSYGALLAFITLLAWRATAETHRSWELGAVAPTPLRTPLVVPQGIWTVLLWVFAALIFARIITTLRLLLRPADGVALAARCLDISTVAEETEAELTSYRSRANANGDKA